MSAIALSVAGIKQRAAHGLCMRCTVFWLGYAVLLAQVFSS